jgi:hypothetical protein
MQVFDYRVSDARNDVTLHKTTVDKHHNLIATDERKNI